MADHPADVGGGPEHLAGIDAVDVLHRPFERDHVAAIVAHDALGLAGRAGGVEDVERVGGGERHAIDFSAAGARHRFGKIVVAAGDELAGLRLALQHQAGLRLVGRAGDRRVEQRLVGDGAAGLDAARAGDDELRPGIVDAGGELGRGKAAEDDGMHGAEPGAGEHRKNRLRHHRHVDDDAVALLDAEIHAARRRAPALRRAARRS